MSDRVPSGKILRRLFGLLKPYRGPITLGILLLLASMPGELAPAFAWMYVVDGLIKPTDNPTIRICHEIVSLHGHIVSKGMLLLSTLVWMAGIYVVFETLETISGNLMQRTAERFIRDLRQRVYGKLQAQSLSYLQKQRSGDLMSRAIGDVDEIRGFIVGGIDQIIGEGLLWVITVVIVMLLDWRVASVSLLPLIAVYGLLRVFNARVQPIYKTAREAAGRVSSRLQENLSGVVVIKIYGREKAEEERFREVTDDNFRQQVRAINARTIYFPFARAVGFLSNVFMVGLGGWSILSGGSFTLGKLLAFRAYWWRLFGPVQTLARVNDMVQRAVAACRRVFEVLDAPADVADSPTAKAASEVQGRLALDNVDFGYGEKGEVVLRNVSIDIPAGKTVALVGPSGAGKTTVLNLLLRFYDPLAGRVLLDGHDLQSVTLASLRRQMALVQQETFLFNESIADNIRYGHVEASMDNVIAAAKAANAHSFITRLSDGYDTIVGERGVRLSGGQKQRISLARAFLANPKILMLDEPTSSVEPDSEAAIIAAIDRLMVGRTTVLTSHRPSLVEQADLVYVIDGGGVSDSGTVDEVRARHVWFDRFMGADVEGVEA